MGDSADDKQPRNSKEYAIKGINEDKTTNMKIKNLY